MFEKVEKRLSLIGLPIILAIVGAAILLLARGGPAALDVLAGPQPTATVTPSVTSTFTETPTDTPTFTLTPSDTPTVTPTFTPVPISVSSSSQPVTGFVGSINVPAGDFNADVSFSPPLSSGSYNLQATAIGASCLVTAKTASGFSVTCSGPGSLDWAVLAPEATGGAGAISITNVHQDDLPKTCFDVMDGGLTFLFSVCDNDFQGAPASHAACDDGNDTICNDEDLTDGSVIITMNPAVYNVEVGKTPLNVTADTTTRICGGGPVCSLTFTNTSGARPWNPWDVAGPGNSWPPDGVVDLPNDILSVILHFCPIASDPCAKP